MDGKSIRWTTRGVSARGPAIAGHGSRTPAPPIVKVETRGFSRLTCGGRTA